MCLSKNKQAGEHIIGIEGVVTARDQIPYLFQSVIWRVIVAGILSWLTYVFYILRVSIKTITRASGSEKPSRNLETSEEETEYKECSSTTTKRQPN